MNETPNKSASWCAAGSIDVETTTEAEMQVVPPPHDEELVVADKPTELPLGYYEWVAADVYEDGELVGRTWSARSRLATPPSVIEDDR